MTNNKRNYPPSDDVECLKNDARRYLESRQDSNREIASHQSILNFLMNQLLRTFVTFDQQMTRMSKTLGKLVT